MGIEAERLAFAVRENKVRGACRLPESFVEVVGAIEEHGAWWPELEEAMSRLSLRLDRATGQPAPKVFRG